MAISFHSVLLDIRQICYEFNGFRIIFRFLYFVTVTIHSAGELIRGNQVLNILGGGVITQAHFSQIFKGDTP